MKKQMVVRSLFIASLMSGALLIPHTVIAETSVVVHPSNDITLSRKDIQRIYLGKLRTFPNRKESVLPINQALSSSSRIQFEKVVLNKTPQQLKSYWARRVFTGKGVPPTVAINADEVRKLVAKNPSTIGYMDSLNVDSSVKVVLSF